MTDKTHCPGFEQNKNLKTVVCKCPDCGTKVEVFSDELDRLKKCSGCGREIDPSQCKIDGRV
ncbi:MAG: hypothetical protein EHJ94_02135 [Deltaproteobacteria bacterium]|nr:MAG: hypothetical protein EHJ94_02135 [Deltaproteobacteria bacterium]